MARILAPGREFFLGEYLPSATLGGQVSGISTPVTKGPGDQACSVLALELGQKVAQVIRNGLRAHVKHRCGKPGRKTRGNELEELRLRLGERRRVRVRQGTGKVLPLDPAGRPHPAPVKGTPYPTNVRHRDLLADARRD
jgi:hypothetical protein